MIKKMAVLVILLFALFLRVYRLGDVPPNLHADEASFIINSASIIESGRDEDNRLLPIYLYSIKDFKPALYSYLQVPVFILFGLSAFTSRLPAVFFGLISLVAFYLLADEIFGDLRYAIIALAILSISPWHIAISRATQEVIMSFTFCLLSFLLLFRFIKKWDAEQKISYLMIALMMISNLLAMYSYHSYKIFIPIIFVVIAIYLYLSSAKSTKKSAIQVPALISATVLIPFVLTFAGAMVRFSAIGLLSSDLPKAMIFEYTTQVTGSAPIWFLRAFYNKPVFYLREFLHNYFSHYTGNYLFLQGGKTARYLIPDQGWFHIIELPLLILGTVYILIKKKKALLKLFLAIIFIAYPLAASFTTEDIPSSDRPFQGIIFYSFIVTLGLQVILEIKNKYLCRLLIGAMIVGYAWSFGYFYNQYFNLMPTYHQYHRSQDYQILAEAIVETQDDYERVIVSNDLRELYIYLWLENQIEISDLQQLPLARYEDEYQVGKYVFNRDQCNFSEATANDLLVGASSCVSRSAQNIKVIKETHFDDLTVAHTLYSL